MICHVRIDNAFLYIRIENPLFNLQCHRISEISGIPTLLYGIAGLLWAKHTEIVHTSNGKPVTIYFWYQETKNSKY